MSTCITPAHERMLALVNQLRAQHGSLPLRISQALHNAAAEKAQLMATGDWFAHDEPGPLGRSARELVLDHGYPASAATGENILWGTGNADNAFAVWRDSPAHFENMISARYTEIGIALNVEPDWDYEGDVFGVGVQEFGGGRTTPAVTCGGSGEPAPKPPRPAPTPTPRPPLPAERPPRNDRRRRRVLRRILRRIRRR